MYDDSFRARYTTLPVATYCGNHKPRPTRRTSLSHCHREMELLLLLEGTAIFHVDGEDHRLSVGDLLLVSPYRVHATTFLRGNACRHVCLCFAPELLWDTALVEALETGSRTAVPHLCARHPAAAPMADALMEAVEAHAEGGEGWELLTVGALSRFFGLCQRHGLLCEGAELSRVGDFCRRAMAYMEAHYTESVTSSDAAAALYMSNGHFCRSFKERFGHTFGEYLNRMRVERAALLLRQTDEPISQIAERVGFCGFSYFGLRFREQIGMSPTEYRKKYAE